MTFVDFERDIVYLEGKANFIWYRPLCSVTTAKWNMRAFSDFEKIQIVAFGLRFEWDFGGIKLEELKSLREFFFRS